MAAETSSRQSRIAPWKIKSDEEKRLARLADENWEGTRAYVRYYRDSDPEYFAKGLSMIDKTIDLFCGDTICSEQRESYQMDMVYSLHRFGCMFDEYFLYHFPILNTKGRESFITDKIRWDYYDRLNTNADDSIFDNKLKTYHRFGRYFNRELICISGADEKSAFFRFLDRHERFMVKPCDGSGGRGIEIIDSGKNAGEAIFLSLLRTREGGFIAEELIRQSPAMASLHPNSVNTLRIPTVRTKEDVVLFHPLLRVGVGDGFIDNATSGGIFALVDPGTGILFTEARDEKGHRFITHPDTCVPFPGFKLPDWEQAVSLAKELSLQVRSHRYVGWDLAHTDNGWVLVEGNPCGQIVMMQLFYESGFRDELEELIRQGV